ncbi:DNA processing protein [Anaerosolibacter carboniphilus]|uniref:DNA processing protein n=1 Tax=Anaerosolibacter carboniphilus TaxID=1417629 RepID=A0A841L279_9FIRM|nr:DNA-processing protein DprA [Anaerosolibacter carboniphilus]MBB6216465.1 DNA processing protein [Anaerosolibacter carboniphilus]
MEEKYYLAWLNYVNGVGLKTIEALIRRFGSARNVFFASASELLRSDGINENIIHNILQNRDEERIEAQRIIIEKLGIDILSRNDMEFPCNLRNIYDPPYLLYKIGSIHTDDETAVAIVGARKATPYGKWAAYKLAGDLAKRGITVVSGMAYGIDTAAHRGALDNGGRTIAVLGCGVDICYPKSNYSLMKEIQKNGAVVSEYAIGTPPLPNHFPPRNRIISGMAKGIVVIEANEKSGSLITAEFALEQGREVFAVPGNINSSLSRGTNQLIKDGAKIVTCVEDILEELGMEEVKAIDQQMIELSTHEMEIYHTVKECQPVHMEILSLKTKQSIDNINSIVTILQLKGLVELLPGKILIAR